MLRNFLFFMALYTNHILHPLYKLFKLYTYNDGENLSLGLQFKYRTHESTVHILKVSMIPPENSVYYDTRYFGQLGMVLDLL